MRRLPSLSVSVQAWREAKALVAVPRLRVWTMAILGAGVGITESMFLAILASVGVAIAGDDAGAVRIPLVGSIQGVSTQTLFLAGVALALVTAAAQFFIVLNTARINSRTISTLRRDLYGDFVHTSWPTQRGEVESALLAYIVNHIPRVANMITAIISQLTAGITLLVFIVAAIAISPVIGALVVALGIVLYVGFRPVRRLASGSGEEAKEATRKLFSSFVDAVAASREIKTYGVEDPIQRRINVEIEELERPSYRLRLVQGFLPVLYQRLVFLIVLGGLAAVYALDVNDVGAIGAAMLIVLRAMQQAQAIQAAEPGIAEARPWISELTARRDRYRENVSRFGDAPLERVDDIAFTNVSFRYDAEGAALALDDVSFSAKRGELIGIIGPSGSGKSTLTELILRLDLPHSGTYTVNGRDAREYRADEWTREVVLVPQMSHLIAASVAENITFMRDGISADDVADAVRRAHLADEIAEFENGFDTLIGERGHRGLSGGQRQRLSIARAVVRPPSLIVLDEPTSALDHQAEDVIVETIEALRAHACVIVVAHRLSTLRHCDRVLVLRDGKREAFCTLDELAEASPFFREARATNSF